MEQLSLLDFTYWFWWGKIFTHGEMSASRVGVAIPAAAKARGCSCHAAPLAKVSSSEECRDSQWPRLWVSVVVAKVFRVFSVKDWWGPLDLFFFTQGRHG